jgi:hypothetical protein
MTWLLSVKPSTAKGKRYTATFCKCKEKNACEGTNHTTTHFGDPTATTYVDSASAEKKKAYLARHSKSPGQDWSKPTTAGSLSRYLLWGPHKSLRENIKVFKKKFNL